MNRKQFSTSFCFVAMLLSLLSISLATSPARATDQTPDQKEQQREEKEGKEAADDIAKHAKFSTDKALIDRVSSIGAKIAAIADQTKVPAGFGNSQVYPFKYTYTIIDEKEVNAFSLPGGHIYIYKGLLDLLTSDDEIAGVLGHETAHAAHHHVSMLEHEQEKMTSQLALGALVAVLAHVPVQDIGNLAQGAEYTQQAILNNHFSESAEEDADHTGMIFMQKAGYDPVGMLALLQRLKAVEDRSPDIELGFLRDHPLTSDRLIAARAELKVLGVNVNPAALRRASGSMIASVADAGKFSVVTIGKNTIFQTDIANHDQAAAAAAALNKLLDSNLQLYEVKADGPTLIARGQPLYQFTEADEKAAAVTPTPTPDALALSAATTIRTLLWSETVNSTSETDIPSAETVQPAP